METCMVELDGRVAIVTGAGRGLGREYALCLASHGVRVVVNDVGTSNDGTGLDCSPAQAVVDEIVAGGGEAIVDCSDVASWSGGEAVVHAALDAFGELDILINNAGILRDSTIINMSEEDFDEVIRVHMKGHAAPTKFAATYWRAQHKDGVDRRRNLVHTGSTSGIYANPGQSNYGPAKSGIVTYNQIAAAELSKYGVVSNCVLPGARTRLTLSSPGLPEIMEAPAEGFDQWDPANVAPIVAYLANAACPFTGEAFYVQGGTVRRLEPWSLTGQSIERPVRWSVDDLDEAMGAFRPSH
ncbi:NAD(P)-dependent dehydrogenase (short-subunit alcohol dehydrogenase family) [Ilumatobacter fluminis]|uniref:NAD(P)-dependent dehydrogenase (Short-subunit alcohol dehydrogenase family) n=2 Tax=Ilumatobacter fluminis TaxID=467091 RepID=A0A4R7I0K0_9ACTN|nr:NAD(P)-dependent dehydrogenase (short-subunit alcohol dehydrogenase family) [Ilumatobacter fluminis]